MRTHTVTERNRMRSGVRQYHIKLEVRNISGTWIDVSRFLMAATVSASLDNPVMTANFTLVKVADGQSASPLMVGSTLNRDDLLNYAPLFNSSNRFRFSVAVLAPGVAPLTADWHQLIEGKIDHPEWAPRTTMTFSGRDIGAYLLDNVIDEPRVYSTDSGMYVEAVMQQIILDNMSTETLVTPVLPDPAWVITAYEQLPDVPVLTAIRDLAAQIGWDVRYDYVGAGNTLQLLFYEPDRAKTTADESFGPGDYKDIPTIGFDDEGVRNDLKLWFYDRTIGGALTFRRVKDDGSIAAFGRRFMQLAGDAVKGIDTPEEALRMLNAMILDTAVPFLDHSSLTKLWWPVQIGDLYEFVANNNHYDENQKFAVIAYQHDFAIVNNVFTADTTMTMRGQPSGGYRRWLEKAGTPGEDPTGLPAPVFDELLGEGSALGGTANDGRIWWGVTWDDNTEFIGIWAEESQDTTNVSTPDVDSSAELCGYFYRPEGTEGRARNFSTTIPIAIRPGFGARVIGAGFNKFNQRGVLNTPPSVIAQDNIPPYMDGEVDSIDVTPLDLLNGYLITVGVGDIDPDTESWLFIERDNMVVFRIPLNTTGNRSIGVTDEGLYPGTAISYMAYIWTRGQSGTPRQWNVSGALPPADVGPRFALNTPGIVFNIAGDPLLLVGWECSDPLADGIGLEMSGNLVKWAEVATAAVSAPGTVAGSWYLGSTSPAYFRLVSKSGTVKLTYTPPVFFDGKQTVTAGPGTEAPVLTKSIKLVNGFPQLHILWTNTNSVAQQLILEQSDPGAGVWVELFSYANLPSGDYNAAPWTFTAKDYRMRAWDGASTIATSATLAYDGQL